jgi:hypothetical protein
MTRHPSVPLAGYLCAVIGFLFSPLTPEAFAAGEVRVYKTIRHANNTTTTCGPYNYDEGQAITIDVTQDSDVLCCCGVIEQIRINAEAVTLNGNGQLYDVGLVTISGTRAANQTLKVLGRFRNSSG